MLIGYHGTYVNRTGILAGKYCLYSSNFFRFPGINIKDSSMREGTVQNGAEKHPGQFYILKIQGLARGLVRGIQLSQALSHHSQSPHLFSPSSIKENRLSR